MSKLKIVSQGYANGYYEITEYFASLNILRDGEEIEVGLHYFPETEKVSLWDDEDGQIQLDEAETKMLLEYARTMDVDNLEYL